MLAAAPMPRTQAANSSGEGLNAERIDAWGQQMHAVHQRLRDALDIVRESIENGNHPESIAGDLQVFCGGFCLALTGHHLSEDAALFPRVLGVEPGLADTVTKLMQDHSMIAHLIQGLEHAMKASENTETLLRNLDGIDAVMETHFRFEEKQLVVLLDRMQIPGATRVELFGPIA
jgi:hemerythrin-like domain-containing protein